MKNLLFVSISIILLISCKPSLLKGYHQQERQIIGQNNIPPLLTDTDGLQKYNITFDFRKNHFSGLLLIKKTGPETYRLLFNSHFGMSLFDMELTADSLHIHHCIEPLQRKQLLRLIKRDFSILLGLHIKDNEESIIYTDTNHPDKFIYKLAGKESNGYYLYNNTSNRTEQILSGKGLGKTMFCLTCEDENDFIKVIHCRIGLVITLQSI